MFGDKVIEEKPMTLVELRDLLGERKKDKELTYEQDLALKYAKRFAKLTPKQLEKIREELGQVEKLDEQTRVKIIDIIPQTKEVLELILPKNMVLDSETTERVLDVTKKYGK